MLTTWSYAGVFPCLSQGWCANPQGTHDTYIPMAIVSSCSLVKRGLYSLRITDGEVGLLRLICRPSKWYYIAYRSSINKIFHCSAPKTRLSLEGISSQHNAQNAFYDQNLANQPFPRTTGHHGLDCSMKSSSSVTPAMHIHRLYEKSTLKSNSPIKDPVSQIARIFLDTTVVPRPATAPEVIIVHRIVVV